MQRAKQARAARIAPAGDAAVLVRLGSRPGPSATRKVLALVASLDAAPPPGLVDVVPAYASVLVRFDPLMIEPPAMTAFLEGLLNHSSAGPLPRGRIVRIPVYYGGDNGPDLDGVAELLGLSPAEIVQRHSSVTYKVAFLGFLAGYPYLTGLPGKLAVPRLATPRTRVPAGSVAIAERQAGIYPVDSPGGWRLLGRTPMLLFDPSRNPPSLLLPGDRVRFYPASPSERAVIAIPRREQLPCPRSEPWVRVIDPGMQTTVQDRGRIGVARYGVSPSGAADPDALALSNALLANAPDCAALEITGGGACFEALAPCTIAITGAPCIARINQRRIPVGMTHTVAMGDTLALEMAPAGMRVYLGVAGGVAVPRIIGSRATDLRSGLGGLDGRCLQPGDVLRRGPYPADGAGRTLTSDAMCRFPSNGEWRLRVLPGPQAPGASDTLGALLAASFTVDTRSDRVGVRLKRLDGPCLEGGQVLSEGVARGAVQIPPDGEPVLLLAEAQTTGGYQVPAVVISADLWKIGQLRPGATIKFQAVSLDEALATLRKRTDDIAHIARQPLPARLSGGFAEWSEDADPTMH